LRLRITLFIVLSNMVKLFITGTSTDIGKTIISTILALHTGYSYWKPIQSGAIVAKDADVVGQVSSNTAIIPSIYTLDAFLSPDQAAQLENVQIDLQALVNASPDSSVVVEGAGGVYVPLNDTDLIIDMIKKVADSVIVVASSQLGTINHTLLTIDALKKYNIPIRGIILNGPLHRMNSRSIQNFTDVPIIACIPPIYNFTYEYIKLYTKKYFTRGFRNEFKF
jgi:dethiobiotin synthetase